MSISPYPYLTITGPLLHEKRRQADCYIAAYGLLSITVKALFVGTHLIAIHLSPKTPLLK
jgi:hypothetical protein